MHADDLQVGGAREIDDRPVVVVVRPLEVRPAPGGEDIPPADNAVGLVAGRSPMVDELRPERGADPAVEVVVTRVVDVPFLEARHVGL